MRRVISRWVMLVFVGAFPVCSLSGCVVATNATQSARPESSYGVTSAESVVTKPEHNVDAAAIGSYEDLDRELHRAAWHSESYQAVGAEDVRRLAAANSWLAQQLAWERNLVDACGTEEDSPCQQETVRQILAFRESHERNKAADDALEAFYSLAETQAALATIEQSLQALDVVVRQVAELVQNQVAIPIDVTELQRQRSELTDRQIDLRLAQLQLNVKLRGHIGNAGSLPLWAIDDWIFQAGRLELTEHLDAAARNRADLGGLLWLAQNAHPESIQAIEKSLSWVDPALGLSMKNFSLCSLLHGDDPDCCRFTNRRGQIQDLAGAYGDVVAQQVQLAALNVEGEQRQVVLAAERLKSWQERERVLQEKRQINQATFFEVEDARGQRIRAKGTFVHAVIQWRASQAKLQAAEGRLDTEPLRSP